MKVWELLDFGTDCMCNRKGFHLVIQGLHVAAQKEEKKMVACVAEGHSYSVPQLKLLAVVRVLEPDQEAAAG